MFKVGDKVVVTYTGYVYTTFDDMAIHLGLTKWKSGWRDVKVADEGIVVMSTDIKPCPDLDPDRSLTKIGVYLPAYDMEIIISHRGLEKREYDENYMP